MRSYLRGLATEFEESTNSVRVELNRLEEAGLLSSDKEGNKKVYLANQKHPLFNEIHTMVRKHMGIDKLVEQIVPKLGNLTKAYLIGNLAQGKDSEIVDIALLGEIDEPFLLKLVNKAEKIIGKKIRYIVFKEEKALQTILEEGQAAPLLLWEEVVVKK